MRFGNPTDSDMSTRSASTIPPHGKRCPAISPLQPCSGPGVDGQQAEISLGPSAGSVQPLSLQMATSSVASAK